MLGCKRRTEKDSTCRLLLYKASILRTIARRFVLSAASVLLFLFWSEVKSTRAQRPRQIAMTASNFTGHGGISYVSLNGVATQGIQIKHGSAELNGVSFADGRIEFDMLVPKKGILGIRIRQRDLGDAEALYLRPQDQCDRSPDCIQYMPLEHGAFEWDLFPEDQTAAPIRPGAWNHLDIRLRNRTMSVYVNRSEEATLRVEHLEGGSDKGGITLGGPATYANLVITDASRTRKLQTASLPSDNFLRHWELSKASTWPTVTDTRLGVPKGVSPSYAAMPASSSDWKRVRAEYKGLVNISRDIGSAKDGRIVSLAWAKTTIVSARAQEKVVYLGWVREVWVYVNGVLVFSGRNLGGLPAGDIDGERISLRNGSFSIPLRKGGNEIAIAIDDNLPGNTQHYGWGMEVKLADRKGVTRDH